MPKAADRQKAVFAFLGSSATHGCVVRRIDTHAAVVFLAGPRALKVKRAVRFPFLDYSTIEKRHAACLNELEVNRVFAPQLYKGVVPITRSRNGQLTIGGRGEPVEWAVEMLRFNDEHTLDQLAQSGAITTALAGQLAGMVAAMQERAPPADADAWLTAIDGFLAQNARAFADFPKIFDPAQASRLAGLSQRSFEDVRPLLHRRGSLGFVRRGHGDLHLGNIVLLDGQPVPFDAIEFDPIIAAGDVLYDLAFLLMDLIERNLRDAANTVLNGYLNATRRVEHFDGLAALPFFMSLRAAIRAKVTVARLTYTDVAEHPEIIRAARTYFALALRLLSPPAAKLIAIGGLSGTGKSLIARELAPFVGPDPGAVVLRSDVERKDLFGREPTTRLAAEAYGSDVTARVYQRLADMASRIVAAGHSVIVDAVFAKPEERANISTVAEAAKVTFHGLFLVADLNTRLQRIAARKLDASDADAAVARMQEEFDLSGLEWAKIDAAGTPAATLASVRAAVDRADASEPTSGHEHRGPLQASMAKIR
jgi:aminoglycoside phosphotransferase family enzyme/predicted kinase